MRKLRKRQPTTRIGIPNCRVCGRNCTAGPPFHLHWQQQTAFRCTELAAIACELLTTRARSCHQWDQWHQTAARYLWTTLRESPTKHVDNTLVSGAARFIHRRSGGTDIADLCAATLTHHPLITETARIRHAPRINNSIWQSIQPAEARWVRCEDHGSWCAVGVHRGGRVSPTQMRHAISLRLIADRSRSCEEFQARYQAAAWQPYLMDTHHKHIMSFNPVGRDRWMRNDGLVEARLKLSYGGTTWLPLIPSLDPWGKLVAAILNNMPPATP
jgi:hypothetical protein